jgi:hypothetical protein
MALTDVTDDIDLFVGTQQSEATPDERFIVGRQAGDLSNTLEGSRTGALVAGHVYRLDYLAFIEADPVATLPATASGYFRLTLGAPPMFVPALGSPGLIALATLLMAAGSLALRRRLRLSS